MPTRPEEEVGGRGNVLAQERKNASPNMTKDLRLILIDIETILEDYEREIQNEI